MSSDRKDVVQSDVTTVTIDGEEVKGKLLTITGFNKELYTTINKANKKQKIGKIH